MICSTQFRLHLVSIGLALFMLLNFQELAAANGIGDRANRFIQEIKIQDTTWKSFDRHDFQFQGRQCRIIKPKEASPSKPWIWRARFPDWHSDADSLLVSEGFHLVFIDTNNKYGSPDAVKIWNEFYDFIQSEYSLNEKVALMGVSRGGLFIYNWAKENADKVSCIYAEAPVCDFKSWPGGLGSGKGSEQDWKRLMKEYGFKDEIDAKLYSNNPIDGLEKLADAGVPVLHMIGLNDMIVPPDENTLPLINKYISLGGTATVVPCTKGKQNLEGHHFEIETPRLVADFIKYHSGVSNKLNPARFHKHRSLLTNSFNTFQEKKKANVAFLGGSITYNSGWRDSIGIYLTSRFPDTEFDFINAGISSMGSTPAAFRLERDVLSHGRIDLLFEEAAVNDDTNGRSAVEQINAMEGIVRKLRISNPAIDIVMMHFVDPGKMTDYRNGIIPDVIRNHEKVAEHYRISSLNLAKEITERIDNNEFDWENDFINLHPSPFGQGIYAISMIHFLDKAYNKAERLNQESKAHKLPERISPWCYEGGELLDVSNAIIDAGWKVDHNWNPGDGTGVRDNYHNVPMLISNEIDSKLTLEFSGKAIGITVAAGQDAGMIEYRIDGGRWKSLDLFTKWSKSLHLPWYYTLESSLRDEEHRLELRISEKKNPLSTGNFCRIRYFYVNQ